MFHVLCDDQVTVILNTHNLFYIVDYKSLYGSCLILKCRCPCKRMRCDHSLQWSIKTVLSATCICQSSKSSFKTRAPEPAITCSTNSECSVPGGPQCLQGITTAIVRQLGKVLNTQPLYPCDPRAVSSAVGINRSWKSWGIYRFWL